MGKSKKAFFYQTRIILSVLLLYASLAEGQVKQTERLQQVWLGYLNQTRLSARWGLWADIHLRTKEEFFTNFSQTLFRTGLTYYLTDDVKLTAGYAFVNYFPDKGHLNISLQEHRPWQQIQWHNRYRKLTLMQWFRLEERWRGNALSDNERAPTFTFSFRARYNFLLQFPLGKRKSGPNSYALVANNEVMINFGKSIVNNYFDQNRSFMGLNYQLTKRSTIQAGYLHIFQQLQAGNKYKSIYIGRLYYYHTLDLRKSNNR